MKALRYSEVQNRVKLMRNTEPSIRSEIISVMYESAIESKKDKDILELFKACECNQNKANLYARSLAEMANSDQLEREYLTKIVPIINRFTLQDVVETANISNDFRKSLKEEFDRNDLSINIFNNHYNLMKECDIEEFARKPMVTTEMVINKICDTFNYFDEEDYGKFQASVMESVYVLDKLGIKFDEHNLVKYISEYFSLQSNDPIINRKMSKSLSDTRLSLVLNEDYFGRGDEPSSEVERICNNFIERGDISISSINRLKTDIMSCSSDDLGSHFNKYLNILFRVLCIEDDKDNECRYILNNIVPKIYSDLNSDRDNKDIITRLEWQRDKVDNYLTNYNPSSTIVRRLDTYKNNLDDIIILLNNDREVLYSEYNIMCIDDGQNELNKTMTLNEFKIFKFDNLITRTMKVDNYIQKKFEPSRQKIFKKIKDTRDEIFNSEEDDDKKKSVKESIDIYDTLTPEGEVDYCVSTYTYESNESTDKLNNYLTSIIKEVNENILNETDLTCYYQLSTDYIEFHIKEYVNIDLTEEERSIVENHITALDESRMLTVLLAAYNIKDDFDYINNSIEYFSKQQNVSEAVEDFKTFLELSSMLSINKNIIVNEIYNQICYNMNSNILTSFRYYCSPILEDYKPKLDSDVYSIYNTIQSLTEGTHDEYNAVNTKDLSKYGYHGEDEKKKKPQNNIDEQQPHEYHKPELAEDDYEDQVKSGVNDAISKAGTNAKLMGKGITKGVMDFNAKQHRASKMADAIFNRTMKSCKDALVSDRREAIIKGSVIPSFSKSIKIAFVLITLGFVNPAAPVIAAIGGLIASKKLTERERSLLLDDIEVELNVIDKEIQIAEANNQMNKYRALMKMKKDLQRQYQRIRYNIKYKKGKIPLPSKTGVDVED